MCSLHGVTPALVAFSAIQSSRSGQSYSRDGVKFQIGGNYSGQGRGR